jgi:RNA polymerase sigma factor (sigma-70 family)
MSKQPQNPKPKQTKLEGVPKPNSNELRLEELRLIRLEALRRKSRNELIRLDKKVGEMTIAELVGYLPEETRVRDGKRVFFSERVREEEINERMANLHDAFMKLSEVGYGDVFSSLIGGNFNDKKQIADMRLGKQLSLYPKSVEVVEGENVSYKEELEDAMNKLAINFWRDKDPKGNDIYAIERPRDLEIIRRLRVLKDDAIYEERLRKEKDEEKRRKMREVQERQSEQLRKIEVEMENPEKFFDDKGYVVKTDPTRFLYAFGSNPIVQAELSSELTREFRDESNYRKAENDDVVELVEGLAEMDEEINSGRIMEAEFLKNKPEWQSVYPEVAKIYPDKYSWMPPSVYRSECKKLGIKPDESKIKAEKKVCVNTENFEVISRSDRNELFVAAKGWRTGDTDARRALDEVMLINKNLVIWWVKNLKSGKNKGLMDVPSNDLFQQGNIGILRAVGKYDPDYREDNHYSTYMGIQIEHEMRRFEHMQHGQSNSARQVVIPEHAKQILRDESKERKNLESLYPHRQINPNEISAQLVKLGKLDIPEHIKDRAIRVASDKGFYSVAYDMYMDLLLKEYKEIPLDFFDSEEFGLHDVDMLGDPLFTPETAFQFTHDEELKFDTGRALSTLTPREERVLRMRFGINPRIPNDFIVDRFSKDELESYSKLPPYKQLEYKKNYAEENGIYRQISSPSLGIDESEYNSPSKINLDMTYEEVAQEFGVSRERIRQIEAKALRKLKHPSRSKRLREHLDEGSETVKKLKKERRNEIERLKEIAEAIAREKKLEEERKNSK